MKIKFKRKTLAIVLSLLLFSCSQMNEGARIQRLFGDTIMKTAWLSVEQSQLSKEWHTHSTTPHIKIVVFLSEHEAWVYTDTQNGFGIIPFYKDPPFNKNALRMYHLNHYYDYDEKTRTIKIYRDTPATYTKSSPVAYEGTFKDDPRKPQITLTATSFGNSAFSTSYYVTYNTVKSL